MASLTDSLDKHVDVMLLQDPYVKRVNKSFVLSFSTVNYVVIIEN